MILYDGADSNPLEIVGLNDLEKRVDLANLDRDPRRFNGQYRDISTNLWNSEAFVDGFRDGYSRATGIPTSRLKEKPIGKAQGFVLDLSFYTEEPDYEEPATYQTIKDEIDRLILEVRDVVNIDGRFKELYLMSEGKFRGEKEADFRERISDEANIPDLMERYQRAETLMGEICAYLFVRNQLLDDYLQNQKRASSQEEERAYAERHEYSLLKVVLAQRWFKSELDAERLPGDIKREMRAMLSGHTDEAFGNMIDFLLEKYGEETGIFSRMLRNCIRQIHVDSGVYGVHSDSGTIDLGQTQTASTELDGIHPVLLSDLSSNRVINIEFLPGNAFFWRHMQANHPEVYSDLVQTMLAEFETPLTPYSMSEDFRGVEMRFQPCHSLYMIMKESFPETLQFFPGVEKFEGQRRNFFRGEIDYQNTLVMKVDSRKQVLLDEWFDPLHTGLAVRE